MGVLKIVFSPENGPWVFEEEAKKEVRKSELQWVRVVTPFAWRKGPQKWHSLGLGVGFGAHRLVDSDRQGILTRLTAGDGNL